MYDTAEGLELPALRRFSEKLRRLARDSYVFPAFAISVCRGDEERERFVDIVDTDIDEYDAEDLERFRTPPKNLVSSDLRVRTLSASFLASSSSAIPFLQKSDSAMRCWSVSPLLAKELIRHIAGQSGD